MERIEYQDKSRSRELSGFYGLSYDELTARMRKPGYRRKMRRTKNKYTKRTSH